LRKYQEQKNQKQKEENPEKLLKYERAAKKYFRKYLWAS